MIQAILDNIFTKVVNYFVFGMPIWAIFLGHVYYLLKAFTDGMG